MRVKERFKTSKKNNIIVLKYPPLYEMLEDTDNDNNDEKVEKGILYRGWNIPLGSNTFALQILLRLLKLFQWTSI